MSVFLATASVFDFSTVFLICCIVFRIFGCSDSMCVELLFYFSTMDDSETNGGTEGGK